MMTKRKPVLYLLTMLFCSLAAMSQEDIKTLQTSARQFTQQGDYSNATLVLNKALALYPGNIELQNDLVFNYYLARDYGRAIELGKNLTGQKDADIKSFQLLGMSYRAIEELREAERLYKTGIKNFPASGVLYNEYGELLWARKKFPEAVEQWEAGIQADPNYSGNYYNAAKHYFLSTDKTWAMIYGEIFVNLESYSRRTPEIKQLLLDAYKKYYTNINGLQAPDQKNAFEMAFTTLLSKNASTVGSGVTTASLTKLRTRFILEWFETEPVKFPFRLFDYHRQLLKEGYFDAYNQWLFGSAQSLPEFQKWTEEHQQNYEGFIQFQRGRVFKLPAGQQYRFPG